eukprot:3563547-Lingulodinium_polyedra.AAC.1
MSRPWIGFRFTVPLGDWLIVAALISCDYLLCACLVALVGRQFCEARQFRRISVSGSVSACFIGWQLRRDRDIATHFMQHMQSIANN